jgi:hypothetical protein
MNASAVVIASSLPAGLAGRRAVRHRTLARRRGVVQGSAPWRRNGELVWEAGIATVPRHRPLRASFTPFPGDKAVPETCHSFRLIARIASVIGRDAPLIGMLMIIGLVTKLFR